MVSRRQKIFIALGAVATLVTLGAVAAARATSSLAKVAQTQYWDVYATGAWYSANSARLTPLLPYLDTYTRQIAADFGYSVTFPLPGGQPRLILVLDPASHGAGTGTVFGPYGVTVAADSVGGSYAGISDFWFYILSLHETINVWTGALAPGWVWADGSPLWAGSSPFPNAVDILITGELGHSDVSSAQAARMTSDRGVQLFLNIQRTYGWNAYHKFFALVEQHITDWSSYPEPLRTAITAWFFTKATGVDQLAAFNVATSAASGQVVPTSVYLQAQSMFP